MYISMRSDGKSREGVWPRRKPFAGLVRRSMASMSYGLGPDGCAARRAPFLGSQGRKSSSKSAFLFHI